MLRCAVTDCNYNKETEKLDLISYFKFPKDQPICKHWLDACSNEKIDLNEARICSEHFSEDCYLDVVTRILKPNALPTKNVPSAHFEDAKLLQNDLRKSQSGSPHMCRICLLEQNEINNCYNLFTLSNNTLARNKNLAKTIMECVPVQIEINDGLPDLICFNCFQDLKSMIKFHVTCLKSDIHLRDQLYIAQSSDRKINEQNPVKNKRVQCKTDPTSEQVISDKSQRHKLTTNAKKIIKDVKLGKERPYKCTMCKSSFKVKNNLQNHLKSHISNASYCCKECTRSFPNHHEYEIHIKTHDFGQSQRRYTCNVCDKELKSSTALTWHRRTHTGERPFVCDVCGKTFTQVGVLTTHRRIHTGERPFKCHQCGKTTSTSGDLASHMKVHSYNFIYKCEICNKEFKWNSNYLKHKRTHSGLRNHQCNFCQKTFSEKAGLKKHIRLHLGTQPFQCTVCHKQFNSTYNLNRHCQKHE